MEKESIEEDNMEGQNENEKNVDEQDNVTFKDLVNIIFIEIVL